MDKETLSNYGWIVICVLVLAVMLALATPFGTFVADTVKSTAQGLFDVNQSALNSTGLINIDGQEFESCPHDYETTTTGDCAIGKTSTHTCKLCGKIYTETTPAGHSWDDTGLTCTECGVKAIEYSFHAADFDAKMGTTTATDANVVIPETFEYNNQTYKVTSIGDYAFHGCSSLTSITFPSVTAIGKGAFKFCDSLASITIPDGLTSIGDSAFYECHKLSSATIPNSVTHIGASAFRFCNLKSITLPSNLISIGDSAFDCNEFTNIIIPNTVTSIESYAFNGCTSLSSIIYEGTVEQWNAITFGEYWKNDVLATYVQCSDGQVPLS